MSLNEQHTAVLRALVNDLPPNLGPTPADEVADHLGWDIDEVNSALEFLDRQGYVSLLRIKDVTGQNSEDLRVQRVTGKGKAAL